MRKKILHFLPSDLDLHNSNLLRYLLLFRDCPAIYVSTKLEVSSFYGFLFFEKIGGTHGPGTDGVTDGQTDGVQPA